MALESCRSTRALSHIVLNPLGEEVDCERLLDSDLIMKLDGIRHLREISLNGGEPDQWMKAVAEAMRALAEKGDLICDYERGFGNEVTDLMSAQKDLYDRRRMHALVGRSADRKTLFVVFARTKETRCVVIG